MNPEQTLVIVTGAQEYWAPTSTQSLRMAEAFSRAGCGVLYIECGGSGKAFRAGTASLPEISPGVFRSPDFELFHLARAEQLPGMRVSFPNAARYMHCHAASRKAAAFLGEHGRGRRPVAVHYGWFFPEFLAGRDGVKHVYECLDDHTAALNVRGSEWRKSYVLKVEKRLLSRADLAVFSSPLLAGLRREIARRAEVIPLGVDHEHFARPPERDPHQERDIASPRVGFLGRVTDREDWPEVARAAELAPQWHWVVLGPHDLARLPEGPPNLHFVGGAAYAELPDWLAAWEAGFVALADSEFNRAAWPLKFYELLAAGLAVASTPIPSAEELSRQTGGLVVPAEGWKAEHLVAALGSALELRSRARSEGPAFAARHSWTARATRILELLD